MSVSDSSEDSPANWQNSVEELDELTQDKDSLLDPDNQPTIRKLLSHLSDVTNVPVARWFAGMDSPVLKKNLLHLNKCIYFLFVCVLHTEPVLEEVAKQGGAKCIARIYREAEDIPVLRQAARLGRHLSRHSKLEF